MTRVKIGCGINMSSIAPCVVLCSSIPSQLLAGTIFAGLASYGHWTTTIDVRCVERWSSWLPTTPSTRSSRTLPPTPSPKSTAAESHRHARRHTNSVTISRSLFSTWCSFRACLSIYTCSNRDTGTSSLTRWPPRAALASSTARPRFTCLPALRCPALPTSSSIPIWY